MRKFDSTIIKKACFLMMVAALCAGAFPCHAEEQPAPSVAGPHQIFCVSQHIGNDANSGENWDAALATIQRAIDLAKADTSQGAIIHVAKGTYHENLNISDTSGIALHGEIEETGMFLSNTVADVTIIDGGNADSVLTIMSANSVSLDGFVIQNGNAMSGAGIYIDSSSLVTITGNIIQNNRSAEDWGGGISVVFSDVTISNNVIQDNRTDISGGGISFYGDDDLPCSGVVVNNMITRNSAHYGGGMMIENTNVILSGNTITENVAEQNGGGIEAGDSNALSIEGNTISGNIAGYDGGGISLDACDSSSIRNNTISGNTADYDGGGIFFHHSQGEMSQNFFRNNTCDNWGGGICMFGSDGKIVNNVIDGNRARVGGGISHFEQSSSVIVNNTIVDNAASEDDSGGIGCDDGSTATLLNTILWGNTPEQVESDSESTLSATYCDIQGSYPGHGNIAFDPLFVSESPYDFHLQPFSTSAGGGLMTPDVPPTDIEGNPRPNPQSSNPDIGAYEASVTGYMVAQGLWIKAVIHSDEKGYIEALWKKGGQGKTAGGDQVIWGYFFASPSDVTWGSENNPDVFVKIWFDRSGRLDVNFFHVSVPDITVSSAYVHDGTPDEETTMSMDRRYVRQCYLQPSQSFSESQDEDGISPLGYSPSENPSGYVTINDLRIGSVIHTVEKGAIQALWKQGGHGTTDRGDEVVWGHVYASPDDVNWGDVDNPDLFVKIWFDVTGRIDVNYFHVSVPVIDVYSDYPNDGTYDQKGTTVMHDRYTRHEFYVN